MKPLPHQEKFVSGYPNKGLIVHEAGTGKTICACLWLKDNRDDNALVVCPKRVVKKWQQTLKGWGTSGTVVSKENFKKMDKREWSARVIDEADEFASPLFEKGRSQLATKLYEQVLHYPDTPTLLLTATPIRSKPANLHTLLCYLNNYIDWKKWQQRFYELKKPHFMKFPAWFPRDGWQKDIRPVLEKYADIVLLKDIVKEVPEVTEEFIISKPKTKFVKDIDWVDPAKIFVEMHKHEQTNKLKDILQVAKGYRKVLVVAHYVEQVQELERQLSKQRNTYSVYGQTKNQEEILKEANEVDECFLIVQASLGVGFDLDTFCVTIFASMSYKVRDYIQMCARTQRIHNLHDIKYVYIFGGKCDKSVYNIISNGFDFVPSKWHDTTTITTNA